ncbi:hypothetical protein KP509_21G041800 [Ceratopteris richardii]|uniref:Disease resistance R13L4/SHOC-2-like LRR domain-containing protein n=1 Tax=Ceratopteris richardii TaxID=49495 RepID=A0A8T2S9A2_CERRI|nr:hypothetical protein KP509_21G041800 [Ceratopteris richardii]
MKVIHGSFLLLSLFSVLSAAQQSGDYETDLEEEEAAYDVLEAINTEIPWRILHPHNLCLFGPHGLHCEADDNNVMHIVELSLGWVADSDNNPQCGQNASISTSLLKLPYLKKLLFYRCFTKEKIEIPTAIWSLGEAMQHLVFIRNHALVGGIPTGIRRLRNLERLVMIDNGLEGPMPAELGILKRLQQLVLSGNRLSGEVPDAIGNLKMLEVLDLSGNKLEGAIPAALSKLTKLKKLDLSGNALTDALPDQIGELTSLEFLDLSHNRLSGPLPTALGSLRQLNLLKLGHNNLTGPIPKNIWPNLNLLVGLDISNAGLRGRIPQTMGNLLHLSYLDLSGNKLEGSIPAALGRLPYVYQINLRDNSLYGLLTFPVEFVCRMGRNLQVGGNKGLCVGSDWPLCRRMEIAVEGLQTCDYWSSTVEQLPRAVDALSTCSKPSPPRDVLLLLIAMAIL